MALESERQETETRIQRETNHRAKGSGTGTRETGDTNTERNEPYSQRKWHRNHRDRRHEYREKRTIESRLVAQEPERQETRIQRETNHRVKVSGTGTRETGDTNTERNEP